MEYKIDCRVCSKPNMIRNFGEKVGIYRCKKCKNVIAQSNRDSSLSFRYRRWINDVADAFETLNAELTYLPHSKEPDLYLKRVENKLNSQEAKISIIKQIIKDFNKPDEAFPILKELEQDWLRLSSESLKLREKLKDYELIHFSLSARPLFRRIALRLISPLRVLSSFLGMGAIFEGTLQFIERLARPLIENKSEKTEKKPDDNEWL